MNFVIPLTKIDEEKRLIIGVAAQEVPDRTNEIMDYATARPAFEQWSKSYEDATGGLSKGNLRVMHTKTVAGKIVDIGFDDDAKKINVVAKVIDDNEWQKVLEGAYTGFSVGGAYAKSWQDGGLKRYTPKIAELSLVDNPCIPTARFAELVKADGLVEHVPLVGRVPTFASAWAGRPRTFADQWGARPRTFGELRKEFDENEHPRGEDGKFTPKQARKKLKEQGKDMSALAATLGGAAYGAYAAHHMGLGEAVSDFTNRVRFGAGEKGQRNAAAYVLRHNPEGQKARKKIINFAREARAGVVSNSKSEAETMVDSARRKVFQEAAERGSSAEEAAQMADRFADRIRARYQAKSNGGDMAAWMRGQRAARNRIRESILTIVRTGMAGKYAAGALRNKAAVLVPVASGLGLGAISYPFARRMEFEGMGKPVPERIGELADAAEVASIPVGAGMAAVGGYKVGQILPAFFPALRGARAARFVPVLGGAAAAGIASGIGIKSLLEGRALRAAAAREDA